MICIDSPHLKKNLSNNSNFGGVDDSDDCVILEDDLLDAENINEQSDKNTTANMECERGWVKKFGSVGKKILVLANFPYFWEKIVNFSHFSKNYSLKMQ